MARRIPVYAFDNSLRASEPDWGDSPSSTRREPCDDWRDSRDRDQEGGNVGGSGDLADRDDATATTSPPVPPPSEGEQATRPATADQPPTATLESMRRALDELEAAKRRVQRDSKRQAAELREQLVLPLLPVLDNLDRCLVAATGDDTGSSALAEGVELVRKQLMNVLAGYGVERLESTGHRFDPHLHDAVATVAVGGADQAGMVIDEWQPGYQLAGKVIRPAKVRVGKLERDM